MRANDNFSAKLFVYNENFLYPTKKLSDMETVIVINRKEGAPKVLKP